MLTKEQISIRKNYVCGSDIGTILGVNRFATAVELWQIKTGRMEAPDIGNKPAVKAGNMLEDAVAHWFATETGKELYKDERFIIHPSIPVLGGNIDRRITGENALLECKTTQSGEGWGEGFPAGDNIIPHAYLCQVIHYCAITGCDTAYIAVLIRGIDFRWYKYERNIELEKIVMERCVQWWEQYVVADTAPAPVTEDDVTALLQGRVSDATAPATVEIECAVDELRHVRSEIDSLEAQEKSLRDIICAFMGDRQTLVTSSGKVAITWKQREGSVRFDAKTFKSKHPDLYREFEVKGDPVRSFLVKG